MSTEAGGRRAHAAMARAVFDTMPSLDRALLEAAFRPQFAAAWKPDPGNRPQREAYRSKADLLLYGGAAGGGKTDLLLGLALTDHACSVIFRRAYGDLRGIERRLIGMLGGRDGYNGNDKVLRRGGRVIELGALDRPGSEARWQGRPHDFIGFDEGAQLDERNVRFVMAWLRSTDPAQRCRVVIASNPPIGGQGEWLIAWFAPWLDPAFPNPAQPGELRWRGTRADGTFAWVDGPGTHMVDGVALEALSCTFIPARLADNRHLSDTGYRARVMSLPEPMRSKLLNGDFTAGREDGAGAVEIVREGRPRMTRPPALCSGVRSMRAVTTPTRRRRTASVPRGCRTAGSG